MSETVPGTFQHSMQVANLAAEAAIRIGAKSQLVRTGALYHDIGKMENPDVYKRQQVVLLLTFSLWAMSELYEKSSEVIVKRILIKK